jgi:hypothetical protein
MSQPVAVLFEKRAAEALIPSLKNDLESAGLYLAKPISKNVLRLDEKGEPIETTIEELNSFFLTNNELSFQWWLLEDQSVYCRLRNYHSIQSVEFGIEGCAVDEMLRIGVCLKQRFERSLVESWGFVFDPQGTTEDYDWSRFFIEREHFDWDTINMGFPDVLGIHEKLKSAMHNIPVSVEVKSHASLILFFSGTLN